MEDEEKLGRRTFVGAGLVGTGGVLGWLTRKFQGADVVRKPNPVSSASSTVYDVSEFEKTDPAILKYDPLTEFETGLKRVKRLDVSRDDRVLVAGDGKVKIFGARGEAEREIELGRPTHCLHVAGADELIVGVANGIEVFDLDGKRKWQGPRLGDRTFLTAVATHGDAIFLADAGNREVVVCDRSTGGAFSLWEEGSGKEQSWLCHSESLF